MRSGSTLLTHLLVNNPDICGYGEAGIRYTSQRDIDKLVGKVFLRTRRFPGLGSERFVLDKVLHNDYLNAEHMHVVCRKEPRIVFLIREPRGALASIIKSLGYDEKQAIEYYLERLNGLESCAVELTTQPTYRAIVLTYDQLLSQTRESFALLQQLLELSMPLQENYQLLPTTGKPGIGDFSPSIRSGSILRRKENGEETRIAQGSLDRAQAAYLRCASTLRQFCVHI